MTTHVSTLDLRHRLAEILDRVAVNHDEYVVECGGRPTAVLIPVEKAEAMSKACRHHVLQLLDRNEGALPDAEADQLANLAKHGSRPQ